MKFGLLLPHFGKHCSHERVFGQIAAIEKAGFNSVWVRDHLSFRPHEFEGKHTLFLEPFTTLSALAALTKTIKLGTAVIVTYRHPLVTSQLFGTLAYIAKGRIIAGVGAGTPRAPYDAVGLPYEKRGKIVDEMIEILRLTWSQNNVSYHGEFFNFDDMTIDPKPPADTPIYYGVSVRRTAQFCDGWLPQRTPFVLLDRQVEQLRKYEQKFNRKKPIAISYFPLTSINRDSKLAWERIGLDGLVADLAQTVRERKYKGVVASKENLAGLMLCGNPQEVIEQLQPFVERGYDEIVFDLRNTYDRWEDSIELLANEVLPSFK